MQIANLKAALLRKERGEFGFQPSFSPDRGNGSFASSPAPSWQSSGDASKSEVRFSGSIAQNEQLWIS